MAPAVVNIQSINGPELERVKPHTGEIKVQDLRVPTRGLETYADGELGSKRDIIIFSGMNRNFSNRGLLRPRASLSGYSRVVADKTGRFRWYHFHARYRAHPV